MTDEERLIEIVRKRMEHLGLHSHLYTMDSATMKLVRSLQDVDGITLTPPPKPEPTYSIRGLRRSQTSQLANGLHARYHDDPGWESGGIRDLFERIRELTPDEEVCDE